MKNKSAQVRNGFSQLIEKNFKKSKKRQDLENGSDLNGHDIRSENRPVRDQKKLNKGIFDNLTQFKKMPVFDLREISRIDWIVMLVCMAILFVTFVEGDIIVTGNRSFLYYTKGFFEDFYKASYEQSNGFYANYLPSTFIVFAIWNLPLYILGRIPAEISSIALLNVLWYKLLPVIFYFITGHLVKKIAMEIGFKENRAKMCQLAFLSCPIAVYSQFIFSQYDIFMVFFIVLGLYYYYKDSMFRFALFFGIAATFKYQALAYFLVFLVLREKRIRKLILHVIVAAIPLAIAILPNINSPYFYRCVLGFNALSFVDGGFETGFITGISLIVAVGAYLFFWAYTRNITGKEEFVSWSLYLANGVSFCIFGFSRWNPQWFIVIVPFLVLSVFMNRHGKAHVLLMNIFIVALYIFSVNQWSGIADQEMLKGGIFKFLIGDNSFAVTMADVYGYNNLQTLGTLIFIIMLLFFVFNHPKYHTLRRGEVLPYTINYFRVAFLVGFFTFMIPALVCLKSAASGETIFTDNTSVEIEECQPVDLTYEDSVSQTFVADGNYVTDISIKVGMHNRINDSKIRVRIIDAETETAVYDETISTLHMVKEESMYQIVSGKIKVEKGKKYILQLDGNDNSSNCVAAYYYEVDKGVPETAEIPRKNGFYQIIMKVKGLK